MLHNFLKFYKGKQKLKNFGHLIFGFGIVFVGPIEKKKSLRNTEILSTLWEFVRNVLVFFFKQYNGVYWNKQTSQWKANLYANNRLMYLGLYENEFEAALAVNYECKKFGLPLKNPEIEQVNYSFTNLERKKITHKTLSTCFS